MDSFSHYMEKQLLDYVEVERKKGIPMDVIKNVLLQAGHHENIVDKVIMDVEQPLTEQPSKDPVENDIVSQLKAAFGQFMAQANKKQMKEAHEADTQKIVEDVVQQAEFIEEKTMLESFGFFIYLAVLGVLIFITAATTGAGFERVLLGFSPAVINAFVALAALRYVADNVPLYMALPIFFGGIFYAAGMLTDFALFSTMDVEPLAVVNVLLGFLCNLILLYIRFIKPDHMRTQVVGNA